VYCVSWLGERLSASQDGFCKIEFLLMYCDWWNRKLRRRKRSWRIVTLQTFMWKSWRQHENFSYYIESMCRESKLEHPELDTLSHYYDDEYTCNRCLFYICTPATEATDSRWLWTTNVKHVERGLVIEYFKFNHTTGLDGLWKSMKISVRTSIASFDSIRVPHK
jgi:hypothetical protein